MTVDALDVLAGSAAYAFVGHGVPELDPGLFVTVTLAGVASAVVLGLGLVALVRRRSRSYLLVALALAALVARSAVAALTLGGVVPPAPHHVVEHGLDVAMAGLVLAAVYHARTIERAAEPGDRGGAAGSAGGGDGR